MPITTPWRTDDGFMLNGVTLGDGVSRLRVRRSDSVVFLSYAFQMGASTSITGNPTLTWEVPLPEIAYLVTSTSDFSNGTTGTPPGQVFSVVACDMSADAIYRGVAIHHTIPADVISSDTTWLDIYFGDGSGQWSPTAPFTWAQYDWLVVSGSCEAFDN